MSSSELDSDEYLLGRQTDPELTKIDVKIEDIIHLLHEKMDFIVEGETIVTHTFIQSQIINLTLENESTPILDIGKQLGYSADIDFLLIVQNLVKESKVYKLGNFIMSAKTIEKIRDKFVSDLLEKGMIDLMSYSEKIPLDFLVNAAKGNEFCVETHFAYSNKYFSDIQLKAINFLNNVNDPIKITEVLLLLNIPLDLTDKLIQSCRYQVSGKVIYDTFLPLSHIEKLKTDLLGKYQQTGYIELSELNKADLNVNTVISRYPDSILLKSFIINNFKMQEILSIFDDALLNSSWIDLSTHLPFPGEDLRELLLYISSMEKFVDQYDCFDDTFIITKTFFQSTLLNIKKNKIDQRILGSKALERSVINQEDLIEFIRNANPGMDRKYSRIVFDKLQFHLEKYETAARSIVSGSYSAEESLKTWNDLSKTLGDSINMLNLLKGGLKQFSSGLESELREYSFKSMTLELINSLCLHLHISSGTALELLKIGNRFKYVRECEDINHKLPDNKFSLIEKLCSASLDIEELSRLAEQYVNSCPYILISGKDDVFSKYELHYKSRLESVTDSALALHLALLLEFTKKTGYILDISGKLIKKVLVELISKMDSLVFQGLLQIHGEIIQGIKSNKTNHAYLIDKIRALIAAN